MSEWTRVEDQLPEEDTLVLVCTKAHGWFLGFYMGEGSIIAQGWYRDTDDGVERLEQVTHWMPLPNPPCDSIPVPQDPIKAKEHMFDALRYCCGGLKHE